MAVPDLTPTQRAVLTAMQTLLASGAYEDEFQATFPGHLAPSILFFKRQALGVTLLPCPCTHGDFLTLMQEGLIQLIRHIDETYWAQVSRR